MGLGGGGAVSSPPTHTKCKLASQAGKLEIVGDLRKRGAAVEGGSLLRLVAPSPSRVPPGAQGCPAFPGGGGLRRAVMGGWLAGWQHVLASGGVCPREPPSFCLVPLILTAKG